MAHVPVPPTDSTAQQNVSGESIGGRDLGQWKSAVGRLLVRLILALVVALGRLLRWSYGHIAFVLTLVAGGAVAAGLASAAGEIYEAVVDQAGIARVDQPVLDAMVRMRSPGLDTGLTWFTDIGGPIGMPVLASVGTLALALWWRRWTPVVLMLAAAAGSLLMTVTGKELTGRARPPIELAVPPFESSASFPSGHTLNATVIAGVVAYLLLIRVGSAWGRGVIAGVAVAFALVMGLSRVYLGHHWLSDVTAAWLFGLGWLTVVITGHRLMVTLGRVRP